MNTKEVKITPPDGYEIDRENSTLECIKFKPIKKKLTYGDVAKKLFEELPTWYFDSAGHIHHSKEIYNLNWEDLNNCKSKKQAQKLLAINKLMNVAKYLDWKFKTDGDNWYIGVDSYDNSLYIDRASNCVFNICYFKSKELAEQAIEILGEDIVRLALSTDW